MDTAVAFRPEDPRAALLELAQAHPLETARAIQGFVSLACRLSDLLARHILAAPTTAKPASATERFAELLLRSGEIYANMTARTEQQTVLADPSFRIAWVRKGSRTVSKASDRTKYRRALADLFRMHPKKIATKAQLMNALGARKRAFEWAFKEAVKETGASAWAAPGRPRRSDLIDSNQIASLINRDGVF
jgi:hypothetical protein